MGKELFKNIPSKVGDLVKDVRNGRIGLPDLQRPFVWKDNKVRELFDSMLKGYPIGYIMLWESPSDYESKKSTIGQNAILKQLTPSFVVILPLIRSNCPNNRVAALRPPCPRAGNRRKRRLISKYPTPHTPTSGKTAQDIFPSRW